MKAPQEKNADGTNAVQEEPRKSAGSVFFEVDSTLEHYLETLTKMNLPEGKEAENLWLVFEEEKIAFRRILGQLGLTCIHLRSLLEKCSSPEECEEIFPHSFLRQQKMTPLSAYVGELKKKTLHITAGMEKAFREQDKKELEKFRKEGEDFLASLPLLIEYVFPLYEELKTLEKSSRTSDEKEAYITEKLLQEKLFCTREEFNEILSGLEKAARALDRTRQKIAECNLRLVVSIAKPYHGRGVPFMDLIQEGNMGLIKAIDRFDHPLGHKFSTYATWWIRQSVSHAAGKLARVIRLPSHMLHTLAKIRYGEQKLLQELGRMPEVQELASLLEMSVERVSSLKKMALQPISLQAPALPGEDSVGTMADVLELSDDEDPVKMLAKKSLTERLSESIAALPERDQLILRMLYGLDGTPVMQLSEVSEYFHISKERIRQIKTLALAKLRAPGTIQLFEDYFS